MIHLVKSTDLNVVLYLNLLKILILLPLHFFYFGLHKPEFVQFLLILIY